MAVTNAKAWKVERIPTDFIEYPPIRLPTPFPKKITEKFIDKSDE